MAQHVSPEALQAAAEYTRKREFVRVEVHDRIGLFLGPVLVRVWDDTYANRSEAESLAANIRGELQAHIAIHTRTVAQEGRFREVKRY